MAHRLRILSTFIAALAFSTPALAGPVVSTTAGEIEGTTQDGIRAFLGIPYAAPPVGDLRWRAPQPVVPWEDTLDAADYGPICPQMRSTARDEDEDCLTLNVWAPDGITEPRPVMVWIHGGANVNGSGRMNGENFADDGVILVSMNYRLGRFGVFAHPELAESAPAGEPMGNFGLLDQIAALEWVQREIAAFGGDPGRVTIFGVSAGGSSVNMHMISPLSEGLFHRAISQSGANGMSRFRRADAVEAFGVQLESRMGVDGVSGLRGLPWRELVETTPGYRVETNMFIDGSAVTRDVGEAFAAGEQKNVPYLAGANSYEGSLAAAIPIPAYRRIMEQNIDDVLRVYGMERDDPALFLDFYGDILFLAPTRFAVAQMRSVPAPAWLYHFDYVMASIDALVPGARHGGEVAFVFDRIGDLSIGPALSRRFGIPEGEYSASDRDHEIAQMMQDYWVQFARTGSPNQAGRLVWPAYDNDAPATLVVSNDGVSIEANVRKPQLDLIEAGYRSAP